MKYFSFLFVFLLIIQASFAQDMGTQKWSFDTGGEIYSLPAVAADGTIYLGSFDKYLYALNSDGTEKWKYHAVSTEGWECFIRNAPAIGADGTINFVDDSFGYLFAIGADGVEKWKTDLTDGRIAAPPAIGPDGSIIVVTTLDEVFSINPSDGTVNWKYSFSGGEDESGAVVDANGAVFVRGGNLKKLSAEGTLEWEFKNGSNVYSSAAIGADGTIYIAGNSDKTLYALDGAGHEKWHFTTGDKIYASPVLGSGGTIYIFSFDGYLYAVNADGSQKWKFAQQFMAMFGSVKATPVVGKDGVIYFSGVLSDFSTKLFAINPDGSEKWSVTLNDVVNFTATITRDSLLLIPQSDKLLAFKVGSAGLADGYFPKLRGGYNNSGYADVKVTAIEAANNRLPQAFSVSQVYPNPFNPATRIRFNLPKAARIQVSVYNAAGQLVTHLLNEQKTAGNYELNWNAAQFGSGVYFIKVVANGVSQTRKALLVK